jgi:hypothetical protein
MVLRSMFLVRYSAYLNIRDVVGQSGFEIVSTAPAAHMYLRGGGTNLPFQRLGGDYLLI